LSYPNSGDTSAEERAYAPQHFFLPHRYRDPFHTSAVSTESFVIYDAYSLLMVGTRDALGNVVTAITRDDTGATALRLDYRVLQPFWITDPNGNRARVAFDALGMVVGTAVMGKPGEGLGDALDGFEADLTEAVFLDHLQNPLADPHAILGRASTRLVYDLFAYQRTRDSGDPQPVAVYALARETHVADEAGQPTRVQHSFSYSDGFGREIQKKIQAEPGPVPQRDAAGKIIVGADGQPVMTAADVNPRWVSSGWTIFNNKGKPVRQYEPFFTSTHDFEFGIQVGISSVLFYDPVERVVATLHPNHTYEKVVFDPWQQTTYDANDTVAARNAQTGDPRTDLDIGGYVAEYFKALPVDRLIPWQTWHAQRSGGALGPDERKAAERAAAHADTPNTAHFDALGRPFLTVARNRVICANHPLDGKPDDEFRTRVELDIEGNQRRVFDERKLPDAANLPLGALEQRTVMQYAYDMLGNRIHQLSMEAGARWMLNDVAGKPIRAWDSRAHQFRTEYDSLRRPLRSFVTGADSANPNRELLTERLIYGEQHPEAVLRNLRGRLYLRLDQAGAASSETHDFKGNPLRATRRLAREYKQAVDWGVVNAVLPIDASVQLNPVTLEAVLAPLLEAGTFTSRTSYDALNRPTSATSPDGSVYRPTYNEANLLERVEVQLRGASVATLFIANINYDAKGQRRRIDYATQDGKLVSTSYIYDRETFRLIHLYTRRGIDPLTRQGVTFVDDCDNPQPPPAIAAPDVPPPTTPCGLQNLHYTYDPVGNITHIRDDAQQTIYFRNRRVEPSAEYTYDAIYRLIAATGREHLGQTGAPTPHSHDDAPRVGLPHPGDANAMDTYIEYFVYDAVGNFTKQQHHGDGSNKGWLRSYVYAEDSLIEPTKQSNRLSSTTVGNGSPITEHYTYDAHGNLLGMDHLPLMVWDERDQLRATARQVVGNGGTPEITYYIYDAAGQRVRKVIESAVTEQDSANRKKPKRLKERIYLDDFGGFCITPRKGKINENG